MVSIGYFQPEKDDTDDITDINFAQGPSDDTLIVTFKRALDTGDSDDFVIQNDDSLFHMVWAYHD